jgi:hypothetical protein
MPSNSRKTSVGFGGCESPQFLYLIILIQIGNVIWAAPPADVPMPAAPQVCNEINFKFTKIIT